MVQPVTVGLDIAKNIFHAYGVDAHGEKVLSRKLRRAQVAAFFAKLEPCLVGIEACATAHHWARTIEKLGHQVRLMPPAYVKPYVKTQKNDGANAEAICEAVTRPNMRFAEVKTIEQQSVLVLHRTRAMLIKHRTRMGNTIRAHLAEFGITESIGRIGLSRLIGIIVSGEDDRITDVTRRAALSASSRFSGRCAVDCFEHGCVSGVTPAAFVPKCLTWLDIVGHASSTPSGRAPSGCRLDPRQSAIGRSSAKLDDRNAGGAIAFRTELERSRYYPSVMHARILTETTRTDNDTCLH